MRFGRSTFGWAAMAVLLGVCFAPGCGDDPVDDDGDGGGGPVTPPDTFLTTDIFLRPLSIEVPPTAGRPTPAIAGYNLTAFSEGGTVVSTFDWTVPAHVGTVVPKSAETNIHDAVVNIRPPVDGNIPLGFFEISVLGHNAAEQSGFSRRFAVVRNTWMKHLRPQWSEPEPADPISEPVVMPTIAGGDSIFFASATSAELTRILGMSAFAPLNGSEAQPNEVSLLPATPDGNNYARSPQLSPDISPAAIGRREILFSSQMDSQYPQRCPTGPAGCPNEAPINLWVVRKPAGISTFTPEQMTFDSTFVSGGRTLWYGFNFHNPRWDPSATTADARIAFVSDLGGAVDLWTAILHDTDADGTSDVLDTFRPLTQGGGVVGFGWHPDGTRLCVSRNTRLEWVDAASGAVTPITMPEPTIARFRSPSVFVSATQTTPLIAFEAQAETQGNIYILDEAAAKLVRILPYPAPATHSLFPRWHPVRKAIVYVCDYSVASWTNNDPASLTTPTLAGMPRTKFPSAWIIEVE